jgi:SAM-dependent methyltransferase
MAEAERWDIVYARERHLFTTEPNALLVETARGMAPGRALDIGMGQGRNAVWLADHGWDVTGLDVSGEGVREARAYPGSLRALQIPAEDFDIGEEQWDLIAGIYVHGIMLRESERIVAGLRPGGRLVVEGFHRDVMKLGFEGLTGGLLGYKTNALLRHYLKLQIERYEERSAMADWRRVEAPLVRLIARKPLVR